MPLRPILAPRSGSATTQVILYPWNPRRRSVRDGRRSTKQMRVNPSLTARLRIGFLVLFALLLVVSLLGVGRLFQIRVDYENNITRYFQLELESERLRSAFILEQASARPAPPHQQPSHAEANQ